MDEEQYQVENAAILFMTPDELERYAQADVDIQEADRAIAALIETAISRAALSGYQDAPNPADEAILAELSQTMSEREIAAVRAFCYEELRQFAELKERSGKANFIQAELIAVIIPRLDGYEKNGGTNQ